MQTYITISQNPTKDQKNGQKVVIMRMESTTHNRVYPQNKCKLYLTKVFDLTQEIVNKQITKTCRYGD